MMYIINEVPISVVLLFILVIHFIVLLQDVPVESHPSRIVGSRGSKNRFFDFEKLAEVCVSKLAVNCLA